jgi:hypothetical protein
VPFLIVMSSADPSLWPSFELFNGQKLTALHAIPLRSLNTFHLIHNDCTHLCRLAHQFAPSIHGGGVGDQAREVNAQCFMAMVCNSDPGAESSRCVFVGHGSSLACPFYCKAGSFVSNRTSCVACTVLPQLLDWNHDVLGRLHVSPSLYCSSLLL